MPRRRKKQPKDKKSKTGKMRGQSGHTSKSGKPALSSRRWVQEEQKLIKQALENGKQPQEAEAWARKQMRLKFRVKSEN